MFSTTLPISENPARKVFPCRNSSRKAVTGLAALERFSIHHGINPVKLVLLSGLMQAVMLPMLGFAALYFRFRHTDKEIQPGKAWDACLIISSIGLLIAGAWGVYSKLG